MRVLVVEDEPDVAKHIGRVLTAAGFLPEIVSDGEAAQFLGDTEDFAAVILDLGLPKLDGLSVLRSWREAGKTMPVIALTARGSWRDRVEGINIGADDYIGKPFEAEELVARLRAVLRRSSGHAAPEIIVGGLRLDTRTMQVTVDGVPAKLSPLEYRATSYLLHHRGEIVGFRELYEHVYGAGESYSNTLETLIGRVRKRLGASLIETRKGAGYFIPDKSA
jgi:two-component system, OmpR family, response regulator